MIVNPPEIPAEKKTAKKNNSFLKEALASKMKEIISCEDGRQMTVAQAGAERLANIMLYAESNTDSIAATKLIYERLYGKAAVEKKEEMREMPKVIFALNDTGIQKLSEVAINSEPDKEEPEPLIYAKFDTGEEFIG